MKSTLHLFVLAVLLLALASCTPRHPDVQVGQRVPDFRLATLGGGEAAIEDFAGKPVVLNFWATWCGPCVKEIPALQSLDRSSAVQVVTIALDDEGASVVRPFVERHGIEYPVLLGDIPLLKRFNGNAIPYTLVLDASLQVVRIHRGLVSLRTLERDLQRAAS